MIYNIKIYTSIIYTYQRKEFISKHTTMTSIQETLVKYNYAELTHQQLAEHMDFSSDEQRMLTMFWEPTFNSGWIYLSPTMITQDMGYKKVSNFYNDILRPNYIENIDYVEIKKDDELIKLYNYQQNPNAEISALGKKVHTGKAQKYYKNISDII
jgi:hypothetical protein